MNPAFSVIFLTTLIGLGQGLFLALFTVESYAAFGLLPPQASRFYAVGSALAAGFLVAGLLASFFHLGRPERAWRSAARWRTSWLSREVVVLPVFMGTVFAYGMAHFSGFNPVLATLPSGTPINLTALLGVAGTLLAFALFVCTGMIYACLRFLREWHSPLTVVNFVLLGGASGFSFAAAFAATCAPELAGFFAGWAMIITLFGLAGRGAALLRNARLKPKSSLQTAIGIKHPRIEQAAQGAMGGSFNTREFFHGLPAAGLRWVKWGFLLMTFVVPMLLLPGGSAIALVLASAIQFLGLIAERWFFFAEANHPQNLYYRRIS